MTKLLFVASFLQICTVSRLLKSTYEQIIDVRIIINKYKHFLIFMKLMQNLVKKLKNSYNQFQNSSLSLTKFGVR